MFYNIINTIKYIKRFMLIHIIIIYLYNIDYNCIIVITIYTQLYPN